MMKQKEYGLNMIWVLIICRYGNHYKEKIQDGVQQERKRQKLNLMVETSMYIIQRTKIMNIKIQE